MISVSKKGVCSNKQRKYMETVLHYQCLMRFWWCGLTRNLNKRPIGGHSLTLRPHRIWSVRRSQNIGGAPSSALLPDILSDHLCFGNCIFLSSTMLCESHCVTLLVSQLKLTWPKSSGRLVMVTTLICYSFVNLFYSCSLQIFPG